MLDLFSGVGTTNGAGSWYVEPTGAIRTIKPGYATVIQCLGTLDVTKVEIPELDGLLTTGPDSFWKLNTPVNLSKYELVNVEFNEDLLHLGVGHANAYDAVHALITSLPVGTPLVLFGFSEGAAVMSDIYDQIRGGDLYARHADLIAGVMYGNPRREEGVTFTDPTYGHYPDPLPGGSGISNNSLSLTDSFWWECAAPGDPVACELVTTDDLNQDYWCRQFYIAVEAGQDIQTVIDAAQNAGILQLIICYFGVLTLLGIASSDNPHNSYSTAIPFDSDGDTRTFLQVGVDHVNSYSPTVPAATAHRLESDDQPVGDGQTITAGADVMWRNLPTFAGAGITIAVDVYDDLDDLISTVTSTNTTITNSNNSAYQTLSGSFPMPDGADHARLVLEVAHEVMTTGIVRFEKPFFKGGFATSAIGHKVTDPKLIELKGTLLHEHDTLSRAIAADEIADYQVFNAEKTWVVTIYDYLWRPLGELGDDLMELNGTDPRNNVPTMTLKVKGDSQHIEKFKNCVNTLVGITVETGGMRLAYYVDIFDWEYSAEQELVGTAHCKGIWDILSYLVVWPNFIFPIQVQIPSHAIFIGPIVSSINDMVAECAIRIQAGFNEFLNNAFSLNPDLRAWFGTLLLSNGNFLEMLKTPIYVSGISPFADTSPLIARTVRMETCAQVILDITRAYGVDVRVDLWLPGDEQPDIWTQTFDILALDQPTYVVSTVDRSQITGPTHTIIDSVLRTIVDLGGSFFGDVEGIIQSVPGMTGVFTSPLLGIDFVPPWAVLVVPDNRQKGSVATAKFSYHTPKGWQHIIGGRSPKWVGAPRFTTEGHRPTGLNLTQRFAQRDLRLDFGRDLHFHWADRHSVRPTLRSAEQCLPRLPADRALRSSAGGGALSPRDRGHASHPDGAVQHRDHLRVHQRPLGQSRIHQRPVHVPRRRRL
jgi:hypothetical protein